MTLTEIQEFLKDSLTVQKPALKITKNSEASFEVTGTIEAMQGKKKVDGLYFASVVPKPKDIRLYFFPIYTHADAFKNISPVLRKMLKGLSDLAFMRTASLSRIRQSSGRWKKSSNSSVKVNR